MAHYRVGDELYDMDPTTWSNVDVSSVQRALGCGLSSFMERLGEMDVDAIQAMIWVLRRRSDPGLRIDDVQFTIRDYMAAIEQTDDDVRGVLSMLKDEDERKTFIESLDAEQRARLFDENGQLIAEVPAPLDSTPATGT